MSLDSISSGYILGSGITESHWSSSSSSLTSGYKVTNVSLTEY